MNIEKKYLKECLYNERNLYWGGKFSKQKLFFILTKDQIYLRWKYIEWYRVAEYFYNRKNKVKYAIPMYILSKYIRNKYSYKLAIDMGENVFKPGVKIEHPAGIVVNGAAKVGYCCRLLGQNVIGNNGFKSGSPQIGNDVVLGAGAKVLGKIILADNIIVAAGAVVVSSFLEPGVIIGGVPARVLKRIDN